jgi:thiol:disulfide interchange protein DsbC
LDEGYMSVFLRVSILLLSFFWINASFAVDTQPITPATSAKVLNSLGMPSGDVSNSPVPGFYQVEAPRQPVLYVSTDGKYIFAGTLYGMTDKGPVDLLQAEKQPKRKDLLDAAAREDQIIFAAQGKTKTHIYVFTDVDCGYCQKLHREVPELNAMGIEVRYLAYPRALSNPAVMQDAMRGGMQSETYKKMVQAWCADDRQTAMTALKDRKTISDKVCSDHPVLEQYELGSLIGVTGTPAIVFADGTFQPGYVHAANLAKMLGL